MEELIAQILKIEEKAESIVRDARESKEELEDRIARDTEKMDEDIAADVQKKIEQLRQTENEEAQKRINEINTQNEQHMRNLEEKFADNKDKWVERVLSGIISS